MKSNPYHDVRDNLDHLRQNPVCFCVIFSMFNKLILEKLSNYPRPSQ